MILRQQSLPDLELPVPPARPVPVRVRELPAPADHAEPAAAPELWAAVQLGTMNTATDDLPDEHFPAALAVLVKRAGEFTPRVAVESSDAVLLELAGSRSLFGGLTPLLKALRAAFPRPLQLALAPTPLAAVLLARAGRNCCITTPARLAAISLRSGVSSPRRRAGLATTTTPSLTHAPRSRMSCLGPTSSGTLSRRRWTPGSPRESSPRS
jgi:hypothetical protein